MGRERVPHLDRAGMIYRKKDMNDPLQGNYDYLCMVQTTISQYNSLFNEHVSITGNQPLTFFELPGMA